MEFEENITALYTLISKVNTKTSKTPPAAYLELNEIDAVLVVDELDGLELDALLDVQLLLVLEGALVEELLELLVTVVNAELFEAVDLEVLETGNIEHTNEGVGGLEREAQVDTTDDPVEQLRVEGLGKGVTTELSILDELTLLALLTTDGDEGVAKGFAYTITIKTEHGRQTSQSLGAVTRNAAVARSILNKAKLTNVEHSGGDTEDVGLLAAIEAAVVHRLLHDSEILHVIQALDVGGKTGLEVLLAAGRRKIGV